MANGHPMTAILNKIAEPDSPINLIVFFLIIEWALSTEEQWNSVGISLDYRQPCDGNYCDNCTYHLDAGIRWQGAGNFVEIIENDCDSDFNIVNLIIGVEGSPDETKSLNLFDPDFFTHLKNMIYQNCTLGVT